MIDVDESNNNSESSFKIPLLDADNLETNSIIMTPTDTTTPTATPPTSTTTSRALSTYSVVSFITLPFTLLFHILTNFQEYFFTAVEEHEFIRPDEQKALEGDMSNVKNDQEMIGKDIDDLTKRVQALEERRRKREESMNKWMEDRREEQNRIIAGGQNMTE